MKIRYYCEHIAFRDMFSDNPMKVITDITSGKENYIYELFLKIYDEKKEAFPYEEKDFHIEFKSKDLFEFIIIDLPEKMMEPTFCHKIILAYSFQLDLFQYFTIEDGDDSLFGKYKVLAGWIEKNHYTFTNLADEDLNSIEDKIYDTMMVN